MASLHKRRPRIKVYTGLTLREGDVLDILPEAEVAPPARKDDVVRDAKWAYNVVAIIDGVFHQAPAVSCGEIMDALRAGVRVYGASSMGALRASELDRYGMIGHGRIYEHIKAADCFRDDFLGQIHHAAHPMDRRASVPYIDFYFSLLELLASGRASRAEAEILEKAYRRIHYTERNPAALHAALAGTKQEPRLRKLADAAVAMESQKRKDAIGLLKRIASDLEGIKRLNRALNPDR